MNPTNSDSHSRSPLPWTVTAIHRPVVTTQYISAHMCPSIQSIHGKFGWRKSDCSRYFYDLSNCNKTCKAQSFPRGHLAVGFFTTATLLLVSHSVQTLFRTTANCLHISQLDGVGPVDNRPSKDKLHHFVRKKKWHVTCDIWHVTRDVTRDTWHVTCLGD